MSDLYLMQPSTAPLPWGPAPCKLQANTSCEKGRCQALLSLLYRQALVSCKLCVSSSSSSSGLGTVLHWSVHLT